MAFTFVLCISILIIDCCVSLVSVLYQQSLKAQPWPQIRVLEASAFVLSHYPREPEVRICYIIYRKEEVNTHVCINL